ncbi:MAG: hypothetical protein K2Y30_15660 [Flavobacteriaceae bacterium]|uniref:Uncharacterized protein n=1 Tax=Flavobacterium kayseriense TaxID=2764714 RepID=A0ABR7J9G2_9FLAO|nr:hypothetical protein [Flavobacterium kayseriense]MBC5842135.1 hypothetical protein [Flavobacterium kayseriense]MBC5848665.1 hypothetical protein [Flavobacterium kayseriense]MBX9889357.1 hypothetical protein [Flavobacteriaceae bacterium]
MKIIIILICFTSLLFGQRKQKVFYNEIGEKVEKQKFTESIDHHKNLDVYYENDTTKVGMLVTRQKFGHLDKMTFMNLKEYLTEISAKRIDTTQNIVINYLTAFPKKAANTKSRSNWNILDNDYLENLHKIADISQFWINAPESDNLHYYHADRIKWIADRNNLFKKLFFPYEIRYGNYILIKPDGKFYYYLGEHSKNDILENSKKYFN